MHLLTIAFINIVKTKPRFCVCVCFTVTNKCKYTKMHIHHTVLHKHSFYAPIQTKVLYKNMQTHTHTHTMSVIPQHLWQEYSIIAVCERHTLSLCLAGKQPIITQQPTRPGVMELSLFLIFFLFFLLKDPAVVVRNSCVRNFSDRGC